MNPSFAPQKRNQNFILKSNETCKSQAFYTRIEGRPVLTLDETNDPIGRISNLIATATVMRRQ